jgi:nuclear-control-of-ATPase protein 2
MSFITDHCARIDAQLDRLQLASASLSTAQIAGLSSDGIHEEEEEEDDEQESSQEEVPELSPKLLGLQAAIRVLSIGAAHRSAVLAKPAVIRGALAAVGAEGKDAGTGEASASASASSHVRGSAAVKSKELAAEKELEWLVVSKATTQVYGLALQSVLEETVALADDMWYWDEVLGSQRWTAVYGVQSSPVRIWEWGLAVWEDVKKRREKKFTVAGAGRDARETVTEQWGRFYGLVKQVVRERSVNEVQKYALSPIVRVRSELRRKQAALKKLRLRNANALGVLLGEGLANESAHGDGLATPREDGQQRWKRSVARNVALVEAVLLKVNDSETPVEKFDAAIAEITEDDPLYDSDSYHGSENSNEQNASPQAVAERLNRIIAFTLTQYQESSKLAVKDHGRPSRIVRYWLPLTIGILSSSTILRILANRRAEIIQWIEELGTTTIDFWRNWVIEPTRKIIGTIRHDEGSEVSIMSKRSLEGDRDSLERMVVDFAIDNPANASATGSNAPLSASEIADLRVRIREGDLTPVLKAYEKDLTSPFMGTVRGNLIRALLIQIQKTKVDVEVAIGGIDNLLKSQELVFGFIGLTPGILISYFLGSYLHSTLTTKRGSRAARKQGKMLRQLRNIDRILTNSHPTEFGELYYKDQGLLLCEAHLLRQAAGRVMEGRVFREFCEDVEGVCDVRVGVERQRRGVERVRWAYGRYF